MPKNKDLSDVSPFYKGPPEDASKIKIGIVVSRWNDSITGKLLEGAIAFLREEGIPDESIIINYVPGSFELPQGALLQYKHEKPSAILCLGCLIKGETPHFDFIAQACANGITRVSLKTKIPVAFGVITANDENQALERAGGKSGNKGKEAAATALAMLKEFRKKH
jgi:6,7-dimethyl-8-ribityllumazine synthase